MRRTLINLSGLPEALRRHADAIRLLDRELPRCAVTAAEQPALCKRLQEARNAGEYPRVLQHRLSGHSAHLDRVFREGTSDLERKSYFRHRDAIAATLTGGTAEGLAHLLVTLGSTAGARSRIRNSQTSTTPDRDGRVVLFPDCSTIGPRLDELRQLSASQDLPVSLKAIALLCGVLNLHPLSDGNGRTARILFNWALGCGRSDTGYLPLYDIKQASLFGFEFSLRELELTGNWKPLLSYFIGVCTLVRQHREAIAWAA